MTTFLILPLFMLIPIGIAFFLINASKKKTKMGINLKLECCPKCGTKVPLMRRPANLRQALWGGCTCAQCGTEMDKWGREIATKK